MARNIRQQLSDQFVDMHFPLAGIDLSQPFSKQPTRQLADGSYTRTTPLGQNVRAFDTLSQRLRGGSRPGLSKYVKAAVVAEWIIQELNLLVGTGYNPPGGGSVQQSNSGRVVTLVAVSQGNIFILNPGDTAWTSPTNSSSHTPPLNLTGVMQSASNNGKLYFADGSHYVYYDPATNTIHDWTANAGILPVDSDGNTPRLICTWRGRTVLSGLVADQQNWFMSAVGDPTDFDYSPVSPSPTDAIAGNNAPQGQIGDVVTSLCPYSDDTLIFFGDHTIYMMRGDPYAGGQIDLISDAIGGVWGMCWARDPYGTVYFVSNRTGIYSLVPGQQPQRISQAIEQLLLQIDTGANNFRLIWNDRFQGLHVFVTPIDAPAATTHFFWEQRTGAWWTDVFADKNFDPMCCVTFDGNDPSDRVPLIGSWDGYVRSIDPTATDDDGKAIASEVLIGPILTAKMDEMLVKDVQAALGVSSGSVTYNVYVGKTAEQAISSKPVKSGTWKAGRNFTNSVRRAGYAVYVGITATNQWAMETIKARVAGRGKVRSRGA